MRVWSQHRVLITLIIGTIFGLLVLAVTGVYGLLNGPTTVGSSLATSNASSASPMPTEHVGKPSAVAVTSDPEAFARSVARALFSWDTRHGDGPTKWAQELVDATSVDEAAAVASDVRAYLPAIEQWQQLRVYGTRQWFEMQSVAVPDAWAIDLEQAAPGQLPHGATALTITGTRHRVGIWNTEVVHTERQVSFTLFIACPPGAACALVRISQLDRPLE